MNKKTKFLLWFWGLFVAGILTLYIVFLGIIKGWVGYLPPLDELQNPKNTYASEIFTEDMVSMGRY